MDNNCESLSEFFEESESCDDIFTILEALDRAGNKTTNDVEDASNESFEFHKSAHHNNYKRQKLIVNSNYVEPPRVSHITVERNRRKQMNEHLASIRSLMPSFYAKRGDQASIIGGVIDYINELQQVLGALEAKKQRKAYTTEVLSPKLSPARKSPLSPRTPRQLQNLQTGFLNSPAEISPCNSSTSSSINDSVNELVASSKSAMAEVEVKFCGPNLVLKTASRRASGQVVKIVSALEELELEILKVNINIVDERMLNSFTIKIGIECQLSAEDLAQRIQQTFF